MHYRILLQTFSFVCLHPRGYLRKEPIISPKSLCLGCPRYPSGRYYLRDYETDGGELCALGLGDFLFYNLMVLLPSYPLASLRTRLGIFCGSLLSIQIGNVGTVALGRFWDQRSMPGLPFPVVTFSAYTIFLNSIMQQ